MSDIATKLLYRYVELSLVFGKEHADKWISERIDAMKTTESCKIVATKVIDDACEGEIQ